MPDKEKRLKQTQKTSNKSEKMPGQGKTHKKNRFPIKKTEKKQILVLPYSLNMATNHNRSLTTPSPPRTYFYRLYPAKSQMVPGQPNKSSVRPRFWDTNMRCLAPYDPFLHFCGP